MKKMVFVLMLSLIVFSLAACGSTEPKVEDVENMNYTLKLSIWDNSGLSTTEIERTGTYTGQVIDGIPNGTGRFDTKNDEGTAWYYEGDFSDGVFHGQGTSIWEDGSVNEVGTYKNGLFCPTISEFYALVPMYILNEFSLADTSKDFINTHENLFPCSTEDDIKEAISLTDTAIGYRELAKSITPYVEKLFEVDSLEATQVFENNECGYTYTTVIASDADFNYFLIYYNGSVDLYEGDIFNLRALPMSYGNFDNVSGGQTLVVCALGSVIEKG